MLTCLGREVAWRGLGVRQCPILRSSRVESKKVDRGRVTANGTSKGGY